MKNLICKIVNWMIKWTWLGMVLTGVFCLGGAYYMTVFDHMNEIAMASPPYNQWPIVWTYIASYAGCSLFILMGLILKGYTAIWSPILIKEES